MTKKTVHLPRAGHDAHFIHRDLMRPRGVRRKMTRAKKTPATPLPVDSTGNASVGCPMDGNDQYGDCGEAMAAHCDNILTFRQGEGTESMFDLQALLKQYKQISGGDNGLSEDDVVNRIWKVGIAGDTAAVIVDALDLDVTDEALARYAIDQFYAVCMAWSVPDNFVQNFAEGTVWAKAAIPNPENGHFTPLADVAGPSDVVESLKLEGFYRLWTWGTWCWVSPAFVASVQPECFVAFSPRQFDPNTGLDSKGRHVSDQAVKWRACGGDAIPLEVIDAFPPVGSPPPPSPAPAPSPSPSPAPSPAPAPPVGPWAWVVETAEAWLEKLGPLAIPMIEAMVGMLPLPAPVIAALEALIQEFTGRKVQLGHLRPEHRRKAQ